MRLSSISSQDSGFTSQDTLFLPRPGSPSTRNKVRKFKKGYQYTVLKLSLIIIFKINTIFFNQGQGQNSPVSQKEHSGQVVGSSGANPIMNSHRNSSGIDHAAKSIQGNNGMNDGLPLSDRPHTISSAYEKSGVQHQRPQLQPYTFSPPESTLTIPETCELSSSTENCPPAVSINHQESNRMQNLANIGQMHNQRRSLVGSHDSLPPPPPPPKPPKIMSGLNSRPGTILLEKDNKN